MKFSLALLSTAIATAAAVTEITEVKADSKFGQNILSKARRVEEGDDADQTWIANMSIKFQGCHHVSQWNPDAEGADDVRIESKRLAKFRLCPSDSCSASSARGCNKGYGDYIVDMDEFLAAFLQNKEEVQAENCEYYLENKCSCDNADDENGCAKKCFSNAGMSECIDDEYYEDAFQLNNYLECAQYQPNNGRRLDGGYYGNDEYYLGTYCASQGGSVLLGMFTDDACTNPVDSSYGKSTYYKLEGSALPYSEENIVDEGCYSCEEVGEADEYGYSETGTKEVCTDVYEVSGKCETNLASSYNSYANNNACSYMEGIKTSGSSGIINSGKGGGNKVANGFIGVFAVAFVALGSYTYYLKTKLDRGRINLSD